MRALMLTAKRVGAACGLMAAIGLLSGCPDDPSTAASALSSPIDFAYACEGAGQMVPPDNDERAPAFNETRMCPDVPSGEQGDLFGAVLNRQPPGLSIIQLNPASGRRGFIDADTFIPGTTSIRVGRDPIRVLRASDFGAFYVLSAGDQVVTRVTIAGYEDDVLDYDVSEFALPGVPSDGVIVGHTLVVAAADAAALWTFDLGSDPVDPPMTSFPLSDVVNTLAVAAGTDDASDALVLTWTRRPVVSIFDLSTGMVASEGGLGPACRDTLDNDGDGLADADDPDCRTPDDDDESDASGVARSEALPEAAPAFDAPLCANGVDDDGDGLTDFPDDTACASEAGDGEGLPACSDGIDNDSDGVTDGDDASCTHPMLTSERRLGVSGPFLPTVIDSAAGRYVYVLDQQRSQVTVYALGADLGLSRVDVHADSPDIPVITSVPIGDLNAEPDWDIALPVTRLPAHVFGKVHNIVLDAVATVSLSSSPLRGELWDRLLPADTDDGRASVPFGLAGAVWTPDVCAPGRTDACVQPAGDADSVYGFGARVDGRITQLEAVRRGVPVHRVAQRTNALDERGMDVSGPRLSLRGRLLATRGEPQAGHAFIGAGIEELLEEAVEGESPDRLRRFGVWPPANIEEVATESWTVTYEGEIPNAAGVLAWFAADDQLVDPNAAFCEAGVVVGDQLQLEIPTRSSDPALHTAVDVITELGERCPTEVSDTVLVEVLVTEVGMVTLGVDPASARLRPQLPVLDEDAISAAGLSLRACQQALSELDDIVGRPEFLVATDRFAASALPSRVTYRVRTRDTWALVGSVTGFLHRQRWDRASDACVTDETRDSRWTARHAVADVDVGRYLTCPPPADQLRAETITQLIPESERFESPSFQLDILPGCETDAQGLTVAAPSQQDARWTFNVTGPHVASSLAVANSELGVRVPIVDFRRQQMQIDAAGNRATLIQIRPESPTVIAIFE